MPLGASPSLVDCSSLNITLGCGSIPKLKLFLLLIPSSIMISHKTWKLQSHKLNKTFVRSVSIRKQITTLSTVANPFIFYFCIISTVFQLYHGLYPPIQTIDSSKQAHNATKTESIKNRTVCSNLKTSNTFVTPKILNN